MAMSPESVPFQAMSVETLSQRMAAGDDLQLIDVREPDEVTLASLPGFVNLPLSQFSRWGETIHSQFEADKETAVLCHHGMRSAQMCAWLAQQGFSNLHNISGGIDAYSTVVDRSIPRY
jgi:rhodanese-related sulfurtransferase